MQTRLFSFALSGWFAAFALEAPALAEQEVVASVRLVWEAGPGTETCLTPGELERLVEVELGHSPFVDGDGAEAGIVRVRLERDANKGGFRAFVARETAAADVEGERAAPGVERELVAGQCRDLDEPLALVVALLSDEGSTEPPGASQEALPPPKPEPEPATRDEIQPDDPVTTAPRWEAYQREASWIYELDVAAATGFGMLPYVGAGLELGMLAEPPNFPSHRLRLLGLVSQAVEPVPGATVSFVYATFGVALCPTLARFSRGAVRLCAGADFGVLYSRSRGLEDSGQATSLFGQAALALRGTLGLGGNWLGTLALGALFPTKFDRFVYTKDGETTEIFQMAFVPVLVTAGVAYEIL